MGMDLAFRSKKVKRGQLQVADGVYWPTIVTVGIDIAIRSFQPMLVEFEQRQRV